MNRYLRYCSDVLLLLLLGAYSCELDKVDACTCIESVSPKTARAGEIITLKGDFTNFDTSTHNLRIGNELVPPENVKVVTGNLEVTVPSDISSQEVSVVIDKAMCNSGIPEDCINSFDYKTPMIEGISPAKAKHGATVTITGTNFRGDTEFAENMVFFNGVAGNVLSASTTKIEVEVPIGANSGPITVNVDEHFETSSTENFTYEFTATVSLFAGEFGIAGGSETNSLFNSPTGIDVFTSGEVTTIYVADTGNHVIRKITSEGEVSRFEGEFSIDGDYLNTSDSEVQAAKFKSPEDVVVDVNGNIFVTESGNHTIRKIFLDVKQAVSTIAGNPDSSSFVDNTFGSAARFRAPHGLTVTNDGLIYVSDKADHRIRVIDTKIDSVYTLTGNGSIDFENGFNSPRGLGCNSIEGVVYAADLFHSRIRSIIVSTGSIETIPRAEVVISPDLQFSGPSDVAVDMEGNIYVADGARNQIKRIDVNTNEVTLVTTGESNGQPQLNQPSGIAYDLEKNIIYVSDTGNNTIRKIELK